MDFAIWAKIESRHSGLGCTLDPGGAIDVGTGLGVAQGSRDEMKYWVKYPVGNEVWLC